MVGDEDIRRALAKIDADHRDLMRLLFSGAFAGSEGNQRMTLNALSIRADYLGASLQELDALIGSLFDAADRADAVFRERQAAEAPLPEGRGSVLDDRPEAQIVPFPQMGRRAA